jgi:hypothetical protein
LELLRFEHEAAAFIQIDPASAGRAVRVTLSDFVFKAITRIAAGIGVWNAQKIAQLGKEKLAVGEFGRRSLGPAGDERIGGLNRHAPESLNSRA